MPQIDSIGSTDHPGVSYQSMHPKDKKQCKNLLKKIALSPWFYVSSICMLTALAIGLYVWHQSQLKPVDIHRLDVEQCPACFGQSACPAFFRGDVRLRTFFGSRPIHASDVDQWGDLVDVELGFHVSKPGVLRRLEHPALPGVVEAAVCRHQLNNDLPASVDGHNRSRPPCVPRLSIWRWLATEGSGTSEPLALNYVRTLAPFVRCASPRLLDLIQNRYKERSTMSSVAVQRKWLRFDELTLLFNLLINAHAVVATTFPASEGWPFPVQLGACGRMTLEAATGVPLAEYLHSSLNTRLHILRSLLQLPRRLQHIEASSTASHLEGDPSGSDFVLYLGDWRHGVFAVDPVTMEVRIVQAKHLIAVDLREVSRDAPALVSSAVSCEKHDGRSELRWGPEPPCLSKEVADGLCGTRSADHNFWAVCMAAAYDEGELETNGGFSGLSRGVSRDLEIILRDCLTDAQPGARSAHVEAALEIIELDLK